MLIDYVKSYCENIISIDILVMAVESLSVVL
jgi:hypothetical protein